MTDTLPKTQIDEEITEAPVEHDSVLGKYWKVACAIVYLTICIFDFLVMPAITTKFAKEVSRSEIYQQLTALENPQAQVALIQKLNYNIQTWEPITLLGGGMFHIAFGAILTGAALKPTQTRTQKTTRFDM